MQRLSLNETIGCTITHYAEGGWIVTLTWGGSESVEFPLRDVPIGVLMDLVENWNERCLKIK